MATQPQVPQAAPSPQQGGGAAPAPQPGQQGQQAGRMLLAIKNLAKQVAQAFAATSPEMQQIDQLVETAARKMVQNSQQPEAPAPPA